MRPEDWSLKIPPLTPEVRKALEAYADAYSSLKHGVGPAYKFTLARDKLWQAQAAAIGPWWQVSQKSKSTQSK